MKVRCMAVIALFALFLSPAVLADGPAPAAGDTVALEAAHAAAPEAGAEHAELDSFLANLAADGEKPEAKTNHCAPFTCNINFDCRDDCSFFGVCNDADPNFDCSGWCECIS